MDTFIRSNPKLIDIYSKEARNNLNVMVDYLCSTTAPNTLPSLIKFNGTNLQECHEYISKILYTTENNNLVNYVLKNRAKISNGDFIDGFAAIYDLKREHLIEVSTNRFFASVSSLEHELIHILMAINNNNPEKQYNEVLSVFGELITADLLSQKYNNRDIYINHLIVKCVNRMSYRVYGSYFEDEEREKQSNFLKAQFLSGYDYMLGFIYAIRLLDFYYQDSKKTLKDFNLILSGKKTVKELLTQYHISLEDKETIHSFFRIVDLYQNYVNVKYGEEVHYTK